MDLKNLNPTIPHFGNFSNTPNTLYFLLYCQCHLCTGEVLWEIKIFYSFYWEKSSVSSDKSRIKDSSNSSSVVSEANCDLHSHFHPLHSPVPFPWRWQSNLQVDSAAHNANSEGLRNSSEHSQPSPNSQDPVLRPMALHVPSQNDLPNVHLEGKSSRNALKSMSFSLHLK